jgi:serine/threonine protein kinase/tetratricopeptide (TPR) repeat protein
MVEESMLRCSCGEPLEPDWDECPACLKPVVKEQLNCPKCGRNVKAKWKKCPRCKTPLDGWATPTQISDTGSSIEDSSHPASAVDDGPYLSEETGEDDDLGYGAKVIIKEGDALDKYTILRLLGSGGFGSVYLAEDTYLKKKFALKVVVAGEGTKAQNACEQIIHEFKLREKITDVSHIVNVKDPRTCEFMNLTLVLLPMDLAEGGSFRDWLKKNKSEEARTKDGLKIFRQACLGVKAIHNAGIAHLDVKPENILLVDGMAKIADFGIGRYGATMFADNPKQVNRQGIGTPQYMSPEQFHAARQKDIGPASDIYSLGVVLYELLDGSLPFDGSSREEYRQKHLHDNPTEIKGTYARYWGIISRCMAKKSEDRYGSIDQLIGDLDRVAQGASLSVDVSCPECGHINSDISYDACEKCGSDLPETLFYECRRCMKKLRLDTEICPACGFHVMEYYVQQDRWQRVQRLKDEDPVEAMELLETVLRDGAGEHEEKALALVRELRKKQSQIRDLIAEADKAMADGKPEKALENWRAVLKVIPRHRMALEQTQKLDLLLEDFQKHWIEAMDLMDRAQFEDANKQLRDCLELLPDHEKAKEMLKTSRKREEKFVAAFNQALMSAKQTLLLEAQRHVKIALSQAAENPEALSLADELTNTLEKTRQLTSQAYNQLPRAEFDQVSLHVAEVEQMQADNENALEIKKQLAKIQDDYIESMQKAQVTKKSHELQKALKAIEQALQLCPESLEALTLLKQIKTDQDEAHCLVKDAISAIKAAKFDEADIKIRRINEVWAGVNGREKVELELAESRDQYTQQMNGAKKAQAEKDLEAALQASKAAVSICPESQEALELTKTIEKDQSSVRNYLKNAKKLLNTADFDKALEQVKKAKELWAANKKVKEMEAEISSISNDFSAVMNTADEKFKHREFMEARFACNRALSLCPEASEAKYLISEIDDIEKQKALQREHAKEIAKSTGKWTACLVGAAVVLALIVIIAISFWRWVTGTVCPWFVANQGTLIGFCVVLSFIQGIIHASRNTDMWIDTGGGIFLAPLIITGVIVGICALLAVYTFDAPWRTGTAVGLVIGAVVSVISVIASCTDS